MFVTGTTIEIVDIEPCPLTGYPRVREVTTWTGWVITAEWADQDDATIKTKATTQAEAEAEFAEVIRVLGKMASFRGLTLDRQTLVDVYEDVHPDWSEDWGERLAAGEFDAEYEAGLL